MYSNPAPRPIGVTVGADPNSTSAARTATDIQQLASRASLFLEMLEGRLHPVMLPEEPEKAQMVNDQRAYPPLFNDMRANINAINNTFDCMDRLLSRVDL